MAFSASWMQRQVAARLVELREARNLSISAAAEAAGLGSRYKLQRIERAEVKIGPRDVVKVCALYGVPDAEIERLCEMAIASRTDAWWDRYEQWLSKSYYDFIGYENDATHAVITHPSLIPGLLQTSEYMQALYMNSVLIRDPDRVKALLSVRRLRQRRLTEPDAPLELSVVLGEAALRTPFGGPVAFHEQLRYLRSLLDLPNVRLRVLEIETPVVFWPVEFFETSEHGPGVVFIEHLWGNVAHDGDLEVDQARNVFRLLESASLSDVQSLAFIEKRIRETAS